MFDFCLQWESQHVGLSCEQYQSWKRENDPEYQRQGLAGYLRDNGISKHTPTLTHAQLEDLEDMCDFTSAVAVVVLIVYCSGVQTFFKEGQM